MRTIAAWVVGVILLLFAIDWVIEGQNFLLYQFWAPKKEAVRRDVYEQTKSYRKGEADRLGSLCNQLVLANPSQQGLIRAQISQEFSDVNTGDVPDYLQSCLAGAR